MNAHDRQKLEWDLYRRAARAHPKAYVQEYAQVSEDAERSGAFVSIDVFVTRDLMLAIATPDERAALQVECACSVPDFVAERGKLETTRCVRCGGYPSTTETIAVRAKTPTEPLDPRTLAEGLYRLYWASGGHSLAAVGFCHDGTPWYAPTNWSSARMFRPIVASIDWEKVSRVELVEARWPEAKPRNFEKVGYRSYSRSQEVLDSSRFNSRTLDEGYYRLSHADGSSDVRAVGVRLDGGARYHAPLATPDYISLYLVAEFVSDDWSTVIRAERLSFADALTEVVDKAKRVKK